MPFYTIKNSPLKRGGEIIPIGGSIELAKKDAEGLEQFLEPTAAPKEKSPAK